MGGDLLGDRMKEYEKIYGGQRFFPLLPTFARLDGKCFSKWTKDLKRPYDERFCQLMQEVTITLLKETNANMGYTQSDEITLVWYSSSYNSQIFFDGKIQKMNSVLASMCTAYFNMIVPTYLSTSKDSALFDCRVWQVPTLEEAVNVFLWRELDAVRNSIQSLARSYYSHKECNKKSSSQLQDMIHKKGDNWNNYPSYFKRGAYIQKRKMMRSFTEQEIEKLPIKHNARTNPDLQIERTTIIKLNLPPLSQIKNPVEVILMGAEPIC